jgi:magnesium transporter
VSIILGRDFVISFQEVQGDVFEPIRDRLRSGKGRIREAGADYLTYTLIDSVVDNYFTILERLEDRIDELETSILTASGSKAISDIHSLKRQLIFLRRAVWPLREVISDLEKEEGRLIRNETKPYLRNVYEHAVQVIETSSAIRDVTSGLQDIYLSTVSNSMNAVMKVLTTIATIFIPLTFIAGIYGMNFRLMPELGWRWGYPAVIGVMLVVAIGMVIYFKRKKWF